MKIIKQSVELLSVTPNALELIEKAGRTCYKSESKISKTSSEKFIQRIIKSGHESVLEHASATFRIITDRGISHEIVRHRIASYSQESTRYVKYDECCFILPLDFYNENWKEVIGNDFPVTIHKKDEIHIHLDYPTLRWMFMCIEAERTYQYFLNSGLKKELARSIFPTCLKTEIVMTTNFRDWRHFIKLRANKAAHPQIREIAGMIINKFIGMGYGIIIEDLLDNLYDG